MERGDWEDDPEYPSAPLPAHERTWRHPSEQGATHWVQSEPPLVVGRGLSVATGTVGAVLAAGLLWLMIPNDNKSGSGVALQASTTIRAGAAETFGSLPTTMAASSPVELSSAPVTTLPVTVATTAPRTSATSPPSVTQPDSTTQDSTPTSPPATSGSPPPVETVPESALAVAFAPGHFVASTAAAVGGQTTMMVRLPSGDTVVGSVVSVDTNSGIAILSVAEDIDPGVIEPSSASIPTDGAVVLAPDPTPVSVWRDDSGTQLGHDPSLAVPEGSLVLDTDRRLIGMCTASAGGVHVIDAASLRAAIEAAIASEAQVWLGLSIKPGEAGELRAVAVFAGGPALLAGVPVDSVILALDGVAVSGTDGMAALRRDVVAHAPGDIVTLTILPPGATGPVDVALTLTPNPGAY